MSMSEGTIPIQNNLIAAVGKEMHEKAYIYVQSSISNQ
jgi:hypothetical protein